MPDGVPVIAGTGGLPPGQRRRAHPRARDHGADAALDAVAATMATSARYYEEVADAAGRLPVLAYHFPAVSAPGIAVDLLTGLPSPG